MYIVDTFNVDKLVSLTGSQNLPTFEIENLQDPLGTTVWRTTDLNPSIIGQFGSLSTIDFWGLWYSNAQKSDWARLRLADTELNLTQAPLADQSAYIWPGSSSGFFGYVDTDVGPAHINFEDILDPGSSSFSVQIRARRINDGDDLPIVSKSLGSFNESGYEIRFNSSDLVRARVSDGTFNINFNSISAVSSVDFFMVTMVVDRAADEFSLFIDGTSQGTPQNISTLGSVATGAKLIVSKLAFLGVPFPGGSDDGADISEVRFWDKALTPAEISSNHLTEIDVLNIPSGLELYWRVGEGAGTTALDESGNNLNGTIGGTITFHNEDPFIGADLSSWEYVHQISTLDTPTDALWFRIDLRFIDNTDLFQQAGSLFLASRFRPVGGQSSGWSQEEPVRAIHSSMSAIGSLDMSGGSPKRNTSFVFPALTKRESAELQVIIRERGGVLTVGVVLDEKEFEYPMETIYYGFIRGPTIAQSGFFVVNVSITEP